MGWELARATSRIYLCCRNCSVPYRSRKERATRKRLLEISTEKRSMRRLYYDVMHMVNVFEASCYHFDATHDHSIIKRNIATS